MRTPCSEMQRSPALRDWHLTGFGAGVMSDRSQLSLHSSRSPAQGWGNQPRISHFPVAAKAPALPSQSCRARRGCPVPINAPPDAAREQWRRAEEVIDAAQTKEGQLEALEERHRPDGRPGPLRRRAASTATASAARAASCGRASATATALCRRESKANCCAPREEKTPCCGAKPAESERSSRSGRAARADAAGPSTATTNAGCAVAAAAAAASCANSAQPVRPGHSGRGGEGQGRRRQPVPSEQCRGGARVVYACARPPRGDRRRRRRDAPVVPRCPVVEPSGVRYGAGATTRGLQGTGMLPQGDTRLHTRF